MFLSGYFLHQFYPVTLWRFSVRKHGYPLAPPATRPHSDELYLGVRTLPDGWVALISIYHLLQCLTCRAYFFDVFFWVLIANGHYIRPKYNGMFCPSFVEGRRTTGDDQVKFKALIRLMASLVSIHLISLSCTYTHCINIFCKST